MRKIVLTVGAISVASTTYHSTAGAQLQDSRPLQVELAGRIGCPFPSPLPSIPPPPPKVVSGQVIEIFYRPIACDSVGLVPIKLTFDLIRENPPATISNVLPSIQLIPPQLTPAPSPNGPTPTPTPPPISSPPAPTPPVYFGPGVFPQFYSPSAGNVKLEGAGRQSICMRISFVQNPPPITFGATYGDCVAYDVVALPASVPLSSWVPATLILIVFGVTLRWTSHRR